MVSLLQGCSPTVEKVIGDGPMAFLAAQALIIQCESGRKETGVMKGAGYAP
jgi:hypothetical protein